MMFGLTIVVALLTIGALQDVVQSCSQPMNWKSMKPIEVMANMDNVVMGQFLSQKNTTIDIGGYQRYLLTLDFQVDCGLKQKNNLNLTRNIKLAEVRMGSWNMDGGLCIDNFYDIKFHTSVIVGIKPSTVEELNGQFAFDHYNVQGPYYYSERLMLSDVKYTCGFQDLEIPEGGSCSGPAILDKNCRKPGDSSGTSLKNSVIALITSVIFIWFIAL